MCPTDILILRELGKGPLTTRELAQRLNYLQTGIAARLRRLQKQGVGIRVADYSHTTKKPQNIWALCEPGEPDAVFVRQTKYEYNKRYYWRKKNEKTYHSTSNYCHDRKHCIRLPYVDDNSC